MTTRPSPMKISTTIAWVTLLAILGLFVVYPVLSNQVPDPAVFKPMTAQVFIGLIGWLFAVALFVERAVEVVVMVFRDQQADLLDEAEELAARASASAIQKAAVLAGDNPGKPAATDTAEAAAKTYADARHNKVVFRAETKEFALLVGLVFGIFVSLAGVRALRGLLVDNGCYVPLFTVADIVITGAMLAGGSEGIHRMANAFTSFMDGISARADQVQRNADKDKKTTP